MRGDLYGQPAGEKYLKIREIRDVDRKAIDKSTGKLKFNIPEKAKFKVNLVTQLHYNQVWCQTYLKNL